jgi:hypothetical protein
MIADPIATPESYKTALSLLEDEMPQRHRLMLEMHYRAPGRQLTARKLAEKVGYASFGAVNLQYGTLARKICDILGLRLKYHVLVLAEFVTPKTGFDREILWVMRPELAKALEELRWVRG